MGDLEVELPEQEPGRELTSSARLKAGGDRGNFTRVSFKVGFRA